MKYKKNLKIPVDKLLQESATAALTAVVAKLVGGGESMECNVPLYYGEVSSCEVNMTRVQ